MPNYPRYADMLIERITMEVQSSIENIMKLS